MPSRETYGSSSSAFVFSAARLKGANGLAVALGCAGRSRATIQTVQVTTSGAKSERRFISGTPRQVGAGRDAVLECGGSTPLWMLGCLVLGATTKEPSPYPKRCPVTALQSLDELKHGKLTLRHRDDVAALPSMRYIFDSVRTSRLPWAIAGVAMHISSRLFLPSTANFGPAWTTNVSPSSLRQKILPL